MVRKLLLSLLKVINRFGYKLVRIHDKAFDDQFLFVNPKDELVIFDIGSNVGDTVEKYRVMCKNAEIHSFEAIPHVMKIQEKKFQSDPEIYVNNIAISDEEGKFTYRVNNYQDTSSLLNANKDFLPDRYGDVYDMKYEVEIMMTTLDNYCVKRGIESIDIIKMDIQGAELKALQGAHQLLTSGKVKVLFLECLFLPFYENQAFFADLIVHLAKYDYHFHYFYNISSNFKTGKPMYCDSIFIHESLRGKADYGKI